MKPIKFIDIQAENLVLRDEVNNAIQEVILDGDFIQGKAVQEFELNLAKYLGIKHVIGVGNGTDALQVSLLALGLERGDEVILPSFTYFATAEAVAFLGMVPVLVDIDLNSFTISMAAIENAITSKTKAIIPVHIYGQPANMEPLMVIAEKHNLFVVEDAAQAIGAECLVNEEQKKASTVGNVGCFSFYPAKNLGAFGDAGAVVTNDDMLAHKIRSIANHGQSERYVHDIIGMNSRLDAIQAAVLNVKLKYLKKANQKRKEVANWYSSLLKGIQGVITPSVESGNVHVYHQYTIRVPKEKRNQLMAYLEGRQIPVRLYYPSPVHSQKSMIGIRDSDRLVNTEIVQDTMISLPMQVDLERNQLEYITESIKEFLDK